MLSHPADLAMIEATVMLTNRLGLESVADGIETAAQGRRLRDLGCTEGQGFLFGWPVPNRGRLCDQARSRARRRAAGVTG